MNIFIYCLYLPSVTIDATKTTSVVLSFTSSHCGSVRNLIPFQQRTVQINALFVIDKSCLQCS